MLLAQRPSFHRPGRRPWRVFAVVTIVCATIGSSPTAAHAHGVGGTKPTNYLTTVTPTSPGIPGVRVTPVNLGEQLELTNRGSAEVTVLGYENEPYLRIGRDGVFENLRSPATYINRTLTPTGPPPARADASALPEWRKVSSEPVARWHDHRAHWMGPRPAIVGADPGTRHALTDWSVPLLTDGQPGATINGRITWVPSSSPWPWVLGALVLAIALAVSARTRAWRLTWVGALLVIAAGEAALTFGNMTFLTDPFVPRLFANVYNLAGLSIAVAALVAVIRKERSGASPLVLVAGLVALVGTALPGIGELSASQLPTTLPHGAVRAGIAAIAGVAAGLILGAAQYLRAPRPVRTQTPGEQPVAPTPVHRSDTLA